MCDEQNETQQVKRSWAEDVEGDVKLRAAFLELLLSKEVRIVELRKFRDRVDKKIKEKEREQKAAASDVGGDKE